MLREGVVFVGAVVVAEPFAGSENSLPSLDRVSISRRVAEPWRMLSTCWFQVAPGVGPVLSITINWVSHAVPNFAKVGAGKVRFRRIRYCLAKRCQKSVIRGRLRAMPQPVIATSRPFSLRR